MNFDLAEQINPALEKLDFKTAIDAAERKLKKIPETSFHAILGLSLVGQAEKLCAWINAFYQSASKEKTIKALYFEMTEFDINFDEWQIYGYAYKKDGGLDPDDMDWLSDYIADTQTAIDSTFVIKDMDKLQTAFSEIETKEENDEWTDDHQLARDWCEQIIIARFMELMRAAHVKAREKGMAWAKLPVYFTEHEYDFVVKSETSIQAATTA